MTHRETIRRLADDPEPLERAYRAAVEAGDEDAFAEAVHAVHAESGDNVLLAAWHHRLAHAAAPRARRAIAWAWAVPLAAVTALAMWGLSDESRFQLEITNPFSGAAHGADFPLIMLLAAPVAAVAIVGFLAGAGDRRWRRVAEVALVLSGLAAYVLWAYPRPGTRVFQEQYLALAMMGLVLLAWSGIGAFALAGRWDAGNRFAFLLKSLEFVTVAGLAGILVSLFTAVTFGLFGALGIEPPEVVVRLFFAGGAGLVAVLAAALVVVPGVAPREQPFDDGPSRLVTLLLRLLLPLVLAVLVLFVAFIPFNFREPFENRDVLVAFNAMLFAVLGLLVGVAPLELADLGPRWRAWLRRGVVALAALALAVGVYALLAIVARTLEYRLTPNRFAFIGWNVINIGVLAWLLFLQWRAGRAEWLDALHRAIADAAVPYAAWAAVTLLAVPWLFGFDAAAAADLPPRIRDLVFEAPPPILLKCDGSPHVYLLDGGRKRWIRDIPTFRDEGFLWRDVRVASCLDIDDVPDGPSIPPDAGSPPET